MNRVRVVGIVIVVVALAGYVVGVVEPYPGRAISLTGVMVGMTLIGVGGPA
jgi:hypothetical protein